MSRENTLTIFLYHGVTDSNLESIRNFSKKHMNVVEFQNQIKYIKNSYTLLTMDEIVDIYSSGNDWPKNAAAVTFDDGFKNNFTLAAPILIDHNIPTAFYVCPGMINTDLMFWVDVIEDCIAQTDEAEIKILLNKIINFSLSSDKKKIDAITAIKKYCKSVSSLERNRIIDELIQVSKVTPSIFSSDDYKLMNWRELRSLADQDLFTIGGHTMYHDIMTGLEPDKVAKDISISLDLLNYHLAGNVKHFSYPEGQPNHYNEHVKTQLKSNGIVCCPTAIDGINQNEGLFELKRVMPGFMGRSFPV